MNDFDAALERLISDPGFRDALAADPARALAGYRLTEDELEILRSQVDTGSGGERQVEQRTSKASLFGLLSPLGGAGIGSGMADAVQGTDSSGLGALGGHTPAAAAYGSGGGGYESSSASLRSLESSGASFGAPESSGASIGAPESAGYQPVDGGIGAGLGQAVFGEAPSDAGVPAGGGAAEYQPRHGAPGDGVGAALGGVVSGEPASGAGHLPEPGTRGTLYSSAAAAQRGLDMPGQGTLHQMGPPEDYHTRVDADGDGRWDQFTAVDRGDRGVDLVVDRDQDGRAEFVGHDFDRDGLIDEASTDTDRDGRLDARWVDDNGDGWLDRRIAMPEPQPQADELFDRDERPAPTEGYGPGQPVEPGEGRLRPL
jgi:hypothetical protein